MMSLPYIPTYNETAVKPDWYVAERLDYCEQKDRLIASKSGSFIKLFATFLLSLF